MPVRPVARSDHVALAALLLDAYRGTVDDEGETLDDARIAIDEETIRSARHRSPETHQRDTEPVRKGHGLGAVEETEAGVAGSRID